MSRSTAPTAIQPTERERNNWQRLIPSVLAEDLGDPGDITSRVLLAADRQAQGRVMARQDCVLAGLALVPDLVTAVDANAMWEALCSDGQCATSGTAVARLSGPARSILALERSLLNLLQRLSGIATLTAAFVGRAGAAAVWDTRKTTPGWRDLEKYAVRCGGGHNHRRGLFDAILIKDNHLAALGDPADLQVLQAAVRRARIGAPEGMMIEVEVDTLAQLGAVLAEKPDAVLLDNMTPQQLQQAVQMVQQLPPDQRPLLEASGGVTLDSIAAIAEAGVDRISVGALTHSAMAADLALDFQFNDPHA